jgi:hypothetical protein
MMFVDHGLWVSLNTVDTTGSDPVTSDDVTTVQRLDLASGKKTAQFSDSSLVDDVSGVLWMYDGNGDLTKVNPSSAKKSVWNSRAVDAALADNDGYQECGYVWTTPVPTSATSLSPYFIRLDPATGATKNFAPANPKNQAVYVVKWAGTCWGVVEAPCNGCISTPMHLEHLGPSCIDMVAREIGTDSIRSQVWIMGETVWMTYGDQMNQVEPFGGAEGRTWLLPTTETSWVVDANGQIWIGGDNGLMRVNIPLDKMTPGPTPPTLTCPGAAPSASPSVSASASASASPTPTPTPSPTDTPAPSASASDSTTP